MPLQAPAGIDFDAALAGSAPVPFWLDTPDRPAARQTLVGDTRCDLAIVGGGFTGLWTALLAKERDPDSDVLLLEGDRIASAATGRNGGFCAASLTHGEDNGRAHFGDEQTRLDELGRENLDEIGATIARYGIDCDFERTGEFNVATEPHQVEPLREEANFLDRDAMRAQIDSPTYLAGSFNPDGVAMVDPARLAWGLAEAAERLGVRIVERTPVTGLTTTASGVELATASGTVTANHVALGTNAFRPLLKRLRFSTVPVYDYVLMTEPLTDAQLDSIGWRGRQGVADSGNEFHYYRLTRDNRILWGGYDAIYHYGRGIRREYNERPETFRMLAEHFFATFPQLAGVRFSHRWGGVIDTSTQFCAFYGTAAQNRIAYALGYTGLGVGATRFAGNVLLDLLSGVSTERTRLKMVRKTPMPFPPEPIAWASIEVTKRALARADHNGGRRNLWLRTLDRVGLGFDS